MRPAWYKLSRLTTPHMSGNRPQDFVGDDVRVVFPIAIGLGAAFYALIFWNVPRSQPSDFSQVWTAARVWWSGGNPYTIVGPWGHRLPYPFPAVLAALPFAILPLRWADSLFVGLGFAALGWSLSRPRWRTPQLWVFASVSAAYVAQTSQWSVFLTAAAFVPWLGIVFACKPTIGVAIFAARPSMIAAAMTGIWIAVSVLIYPGWPADWWDATRSVAGVTAPVMRLGGVLLLLVLLRWRRAEARLLAALTLVPHTPVLYEAAPLFLIPETVAEGAILSALTIAVKVALMMLAPYDSRDAAFVVSGRLEVWLLCLPCLIMILRRPNVSSSFEK